MSKLSQALARDLVTVFLQDVNVEGVTLYHGMNPGPSSHGLYLSRAQIEKAAGVDGMSRSADDEPAHRDALRIRTKLAGIEGARVAILATEDGAEIAAWAWSRAEGDAGWKSTAGGIQ